jgi:DUF4097 and DUF4098 domain-containing protein YvlB
MEIIEIISADAMWEKAKQIKDELDRKERERQEKASFEELQKAVNKIQHEIERKVNKGEFCAIEFFEEDRLIHHREEWDKWFYLEKVNIKKILEIFTVAGYEIKWSTNTKNNSRYGNFYISWDKEEE